MNRVAIGASCLLLIAAPALAQSMGEKTGVNSTLGIAPKTQDFVTEAAISDMFEIKSSQLALDRSDDATKAFARQMITGHEKTTADIKAMVQSKKVEATLPTDLDSSHKTMLDKLSVASGVEFTKLYHGDQVAGHKDAVSLFQRYAKGGDNADLKAWAAQTEPTIEHHLQMATDLDK